jgi:transposase
MNKGEQNKELSRRRARAIELLDARQLSDEALQAIRLRALRGVELGYTETELAEILGVCQETISRWWTAYSQEGADALPGRRSGRPPGSGRLLTGEQAERIKALIPTNSPQQLGLSHALWTRRAVGDLIRKELDIDLADRTVGLYLDRWGYTPKKPTRHARKQDPDEVEKWLNESYPAIGDQAQKEGAEVLWADEVGVQADHHPGTSYAPEGERAEADVPGPHIRVNQVTAISNEGEVRFMTYESMNGAVFLLFLQKLVEGAGRKILLIADRLQAHKTPEVGDWLKGNKEKIEVFYLPTYSPELNPVEYLNNDMKGQVNKAGMPDNKVGLRERLTSYMGFLANVPTRVISFFMHPCVQYAAPVEL